MLLTLHLHCTVLSLVTLRWQIWIVAALLLNILRIASSYFITINKTNVKITYQSSLGVYHQDSCCVCVCVFPLRRLFSPWLMHCSLTVSGQRKTDKKKWFFLPWSHPPPPPSSPPPPPQPPYHQHHHHQPSPSHSLQTYRVTDLQRKPLFTLAVILQVIKTTWSSPTISPLNARCVMTSLLPLPHTRTHKHTLIHYLGAGQGVIWKCIYTHRGHLKII